MKIKKCQLYTAAFWLVGGVSLGGNLYFLKEKKEFDKKSLQLEQELTWTRNELENLKEIEEIRSIDDLNRYFMGKLVFYLDSAAELRNYINPQLSITRPENAFGSVEIPDALYQKINYILSKQEIRSIRLCNLDNEIDLTKLDILAPINKDMDYKNSSEELIEIVIERCHDNFNYGVLQNINPQYIEIHQDECYDSMKEWLETVNFKDIRMTIESDSTEFLAFLVDSKKEMDTIDIITDADEKNLDYIPELCARKVTICSRSIYQEHLDFDLSLNEHTEEVEFRFYNWDLPIDALNQLGKIKITYPNPNLNIMISSISGRPLHHMNSITYITEETDFDFPENSTIYLFGIKYRDKKQELNGKIQYERDKDVDSMCKQLLKNDKQKKIGTN